MVESNTTSCFWISLQYYYYYSCRVCVRVLSNRAFKEEVVLRVLLLLMNIDLMMIVKSCIRKKEKIET